MARRAAEQLTGLKREGRKVNALDSDPSDRVCRDIASAILEQRLKPGAKLGEQLLSEIFGVNRPVVRRALMRLSYDRLVDIRPNRGAYVASPSIEEARQIFEARRVAEDWIARTLCERAQGQDLDRLDRHIAEEADAVGRQDRAQWIRLTGGFHVMLAAMTGNEVMRRFLEDMVAQTSLIISLYGTKGDGICSNGEHEAIAAALRARDPERAISLMRAHLDACEAALRFEEPSEQHDLRAIFVA